ncbi:MAG TPA: hypothetical protein VN176_13120 [Verrucomicrobiae bacterium]|jgi:hypothetical protein|nr:hypothetical protein [Verrucomicrobiae bacterium]
MPDQPQTQTLSLRISEALRKRLEQIRELAALRKGEAVSTSEIAKQLLESSPTDRMELAELLQEPTDSLLQIRKKCQGQQPISRAEWTALAYYAQQGAEAFGKNPISRESCIALLESFQAVHRLRKKANPETDGYYLGNLPSEFRAEEKKNAASHDVVRHTVAETLRALADPSTNWTPTFAARNLFGFLEDEEIAGTDALNHALRPYWQPLWKLAARGHYFLHREPIRDKTRRKDFIVQPAIPNVTEAKYTLSFARVEGNELHLLLSFPGPRGTMYPMGPYPVISEFRAMLTGLTTKARSWDGQRFLAYVTDRDDDNEFWFRAHENGITFGFSEEEWNAVRKLFRRAWEMPEIQAIWDTLTMEYGEL